MIKVFENECTKVLYEQYDLGAQYRVIFKNDPLRGRVAFTTMGEAVSYAEMAEKKGKSQF